MGGEVEGSEIISQREPKERNVRNGRAATREYRADGESKEDVRNKTTPFPSRFPPAKQFDERFRRVGGVNFLDQRAHPDAENLTMNGPAGHAKAWPTRHRLRNSRISKSMAKKITMMASSHNIRCSFTSA